MQLISTTILKLIKKTAKTRPQKSNYMHLITNIYRVSNYSVSGTIYLTKELFS